MSRTRNRSVAAALLSGFLVACSGDAVTPTTLQIAPTTGHASADIEGQNGLGDARTSRPITFAVIGDTPYGAAKFAEFPSLVGKINADDDVEFVIHVGDIKAGKNAPCTDAYFASVRALFDTFEDPFIYTPGDNEWTDCHQAGKNNGLYTPTERLQAIRSLFFPVPGQSLGRNTMRVDSQGSQPENAQYVENVSFVRSRVVFGTLNVTGSNNDGVSWGSPLPANAAQFPSQATEQATRAIANAAWLERIFAEARGKHIDAVVLIFQADMWDPAEPTLSGYDALVQQIGRHARTLGKPVLLLNGDSHKFIGDNPYSTASPLHGFHPDTPNAENVTRIVVEGSDAGRTEYLRVTVDPKGKKSDVFVWDRVPLM